MLTLISPAKKLSADTLHYQGPRSELLFREKAEQLIAILREKSVSDIASLMKLSEALATLNYQRYQSFQLTSDDLPTALFLFQGDVYQGLDAKSLSATQIEFAQRHLGILSGLYGLIRPLDTIYPYRLEMGTRLQNPTGTNLYDYWRDDLTDYINQTLATHKEPVLLNLASNEYFTAIDTKQCHYPVVHVTFKEQTGEQLKVVGIHAKKARGKMARFILKQSIDTPKALVDYAVDGYAFQKDLSTDSQLVFIR